MVNETIRTQLAHRTIREFTNDPVPDDIMETLFEVAMRTATSRGFQNASIIRVKDQSKRIRLAELGKQEYVARAPEYMIFIVDAYRASRILDAHGNDPARAGTMDVFTEGFTDACLMAQNVVVAAESLGLGCNYLGNVLNNPQGVIELLELPHLTFPVVGLTLGYPAQEPALKPRLASSVRVMVDGYEEADPAEITQHDAEVQAYVDLRFPDRTLAPYSAQLAGRLMVESDRERIVEAIAEQGFITHKG